MAKKESQSLVKQEESSTISIVQQMPEYLRNAPSGPVRGAENVDPADRVLPRLNLCSKQSPQFDENNEKHIPGLKLGQFFNTITHEVYGNVIHVVPLFELKTRARNREYGEQGPPYCISFDGKTGEGDPGGDCKVCQFAQWTKGKQANEPPECTEMLNFAVIIMPENGKLREDWTWDAAPRIDTISILGFKRTSFTKGKELITMLGMRGRDWFTTVFKLTSFPKSDGKNSWHIPIPNNAGWLAKEAAEQVARPCYESIHQIYSAGRLKVDEQENEEVTV